MAAASNSQVQAFVDGRTRPSCGNLLSWVLGALEDHENFDDIYANLTSGTPWTDSPASGVPHVALASDIINAEAAKFALATICSGNIGTDSATALSLVQTIQGQWPIVQKLPVTEVVPE